jgi:2'-5' RNA ligase
MSRLFYALWPDAKTRKKLSIVTGSIQKGRITATRNLHITLLFLGSVDDDTRLAPEHIPRELKDLVVKLTGLAKICRIPVDSRPYRPHVTLARKITTQVHVEPQEITWEAREFSLVESNTLPEGTEYKIIRSWPLT